MSYFLCFLQQENRSGCLWFIERWLQNGTGGVEIRQVDLEEKVPGILAAGRLLHKYNIVSNT